MKDFSPTGACRICVVEVEGHDNLVAACSQPVEEWMKIKTHSPRVITARKTIVELLLSNHPDDCLYCESNLNCELQHLSEELDIRERRIPRKKIKTNLDQSGPAIVRELSKCILCGRCVRVCEEVITAVSLDFINKGGDVHVGTAMDKDFNFSSCIHCGQCMLVCPTGALHEKHCLTEVQEYLNKPDMVKIIQYSPMVSAGIAGELGIRYTRDFDGILNGILRKLGFDKVFTTGTGTDISIAETTNLLADRIEGKSDMPLYVTACPAWVKYVEQFMPDLIPSLSTVKSSQQITGALISTVIADQFGVTPEKIYSVSATPCIAMKFEATRDGMVRKGICDVDSVLTVKELIRLIRIYGIDITTIDQEPADEPLAGRSASAMLAEVSGGLTEGIMRSLYYMKHNKEADRKIFRKCRSAGSFREMIIDTGMLKVRTAIVDGLKGLEKLDAALQSGMRYDLIEVMACPGGCIHGAGLPFEEENDEIRNRAKLIYQIDEAEAIKMPCKSPAMLKVYDDLLKDNSNINTEDIFHTRFEKRDVLL